jgi:hypothetical protein
MAILDTLPEQVRKYRTRSVSALMLRDLLRAWQAVPAAAAQAGQISYVREGHLVTALAKLF